MSPRNLGLVTHCLTLALLPNLAFAYVGPGAGLGAIATVLALLGVILYGVVGFVWYPAKRLLRGKRSTDAEDIDENSDAVLSPDEQIDAETQD